MATKKSSPGTPNGSADDDDDVDEESDELKPTDLIDPRDLADHLKALERFKGKQPPGCPANIRSRGFKPPPPAAEYMLHGRQGVRRIKNNNMRSD